MFESSQRPSYSVLESDTDSMLNFEKPDTPSDAKSRVRKSRAERMGKKK